MAINSDNLRNKIDFIGIGFPKSGTSWLCEVLNSHPEVYIPSQKELWYFFSGPINNFTIMPSNYKKDIAWYMSFFKESEKKQKRGEFTPTYIYDYDGMLRVKNCFPNVKLLIIVRNPIDIVYSQYNYLQSSIVDELNITLTNIFSSPDGRSLLSYGNVGTCLERVYDIFSENNVFISTFDNLIRDKKSFFLKLCNFLEIDFQVLNYNIDKVNEARTVRFNALHGLIKNMYKKTKVLDMPLIKNNRFLFNLYNKLNRPATSKIPLSNDMRCKLKEHFYDEIVKVENLLKIDLNDWKY